MREKWIDNAKGIAIILVMLGHVSWRLENASIFGFVYGVHLVVFFLLSGFVLKKEKITREYLKRKFSRLMCPYFLTCAAIIVTNVINNYIWSDASLELITQNTASDLLRTFFASGAYTTFGTIDIGTRIGAIWFLPAMFFAYIFVQAILNKFENKKYIAGIIAAIVSIFGYISANFIWLPFSIQSAMMGTFFLWLGYEIRKKEILSKLKWYHFVIAQVIFVAGIYGGYCGVSFVTANINDLILSVIVGLAGVTLIYGISKLDKGVVLEHIGKKSLTILCVHLYSLEVLGAYYETFLNKVGLNGNAAAWVFIALQIIFAILVSFIIDFLKKRLVIVRDKMADRLSTVGKCNDEGPANKISVAFFLIFILTWDFQIADTLKIFVCSCSIAALVFFLGYSFTNTSSIGKTIKNLLKKYMIPYVAFVAIKFLLNINQMDISTIKKLLIDCAAGMSATKKILPNVQAVGLVGLILMMFIVQIIYLVIDKFVKNEVMQWAVVLVLSVAGFILGKYGYWMPWSIDVALFSIIFYKLGVFFKKNDLLAFVCGNKYFYFVCAPVWVYMMYMGKSEIKIREYGQYGLNIIGSMVGILTIVMLASYVVEHMPVCRKIFTAMGESIIILIVLNTLFGQAIADIWSLRFSLDSFTNMFLTIISQIIIAVGIELLVRFVKGKVLKKEVC